MNKFAFVDLETTGTSPQRDRVIDVGIIRIEDNKIVETYNRLINPHAYVSPFISDMTGITAEMLEDAPSFEAVKDEIYSLLKDCIFVAHNVRFDYGFLKQEFIRSDITFSAKQLCTAKLSRRLFPEHRRHNLDSIIERFGFECENRHRALDDTKVMVDFFFSLQKQFSEEDLTEAMNVVMKKPSLPQMLPLQTIETLPESVGVYIFYDENQIPLYIGKSVNIKDRVLSHFAADHSSPKEMKISSQITNIETYKTAGELGALLLESSLIKKMQPIYNQKLRFKSRVVVLKKHINKKGYYEVKIERVDKITTDELDDIMAVMRSEKQAKEFLRGLGKYYYLCDKLIDIDTTKGECFSSKLGYCKGACVEKELPMKYNLRFIEAFTKTKIKSWPFEGPIVIHEENEYEAAGYIVDQWCYMGKINSDYERELESDISFDFDTYKIIERFMKDIRNSKKIHVLNDQEAIAYAA